MVRVLILERNPMVRKLLEIFVASGSGYQLVSWPCDTRVEEPFSMEHQANLVLLDVQAGAGGLRAVGMVKTYLPEAKIIMMSDLPGGRMLPDARKAGVESFWYKEPDAGSLLSIMDQTLAGESVYPDYVPLIRLGAACSCDFTERELQILKEVASGRTNASIAEAMNLSAFTVKQHIQKMLHKTGFINRTELAVRASESRIVIIDPPDCTEEVAR